MSNKEYDDSYAENQYRETKNTKAAGYRINGRDEATASFHAVSTAYSYSEL